MSSQSKTAQQPVSGKNADKVFKGVAYACGILILVVLAAVALFLLFRAWPLIGGDQKANSATISNFTGGKVSSFWGYVGPLLFGTVLISALALLISFFVSVGIALFISHYAPKKLATALSYVVDLLAAIPSVIYGLWGGLVLVPAIYPFWNWVAKYLGWIPIFAGPAANPSRTVATVSVVLAVMILPIITSMSRDIFLQTPRLQEEAALALGCAPRQAFFKVILPEISPAILSAFLICLTYSIDDFMISYFNCGTVETLPIAIYSMTRKKVSPEIYALSTIMFVVILSVILVSNAMESRSYRRDQKTLRKEGA